MNVSDLMQTDLAAITADASLGEAITMLVDAHVLGLPVLDAYGKFIGVRPPRTCSKPSPSGVAVVMGKPGLIPPW